MRNSVIWGLGGTERHAGILVGGNRVTLHAFNNTIVGGGYGIHNLGGTVTAINNLVAATRIASFEGNFHPTSARNLGARAALGRWILFLDDDIVAPPGLLQAHLDLLNRLPGCGTIGCVDTDPDLVDAPPREDEGKPRG